MRPTEQRRCFSRGRSWVAGASTLAIKRPHVAQGLAFYATPSAAQTFDDDQEVVSGWGVTIVEAERVAASSHGAASPRGAVLVRSGDIRFDQFREVLRARRGAGCLGLLCSGGPGPRSGSCWGQRQGVSLPELDRRSGPLGSSRRPLLPARVGSLDYAGCGRAAECVAMTADLPLVLGDTGPSALWGASLAADLTLPGGELRQR